MIVHFTTRTYEDTEEQIGVSIQGASVLVLYLGKSTPPYVEVRSLQGQSFTSFITYGDVVNLIESTSGHHITLERFPKTLGSSA